MPIEKEVNSILSIYSFLETNAMLLYQSILILSLVGIAYGNDAAECNMTDIGHLQGDFICRQ